MTSRPRIAFAPTVAVLAVLASPVWAQKNSAAASFSGPFTGNDTLTATIDKGKKKRLLIANASAVIEDEVEVGTYCELFLTLTTNGVPMLTMAGAEHAEVGCNCPDHACTGCTANATAYLDLDIAEETYPGVFVKQPIEVQLIIQTQGTGVCAGGDDDAATLVVQMIKK